MIGKAERRELEPMTEEIARLRSMIEKSSATDLERSMMLEIMATIDHRVEMLLVRGKASAWEIERNRRG